MDLQEEKPKARLERDRKAARIAIESIKRMAHFDDVLQDERDFLASLMLRVLATILVPALGGKQ
ncbi:hypothetical protein RDI58_000864 [Solanum bulbocastanum]|uniref:Uncharacterized protein n=1 Tax=Solanum bulbocastanum TaxID=147425 RepID=A0AAN8UBG6_SOLBU